MVEVSGTSKAEWDLAVGSEAEFAEFAWLTTARFLEAMTNEVLMLKVVPKADHRHGWERVRIHYDPRDRTKSIGGVMVRLAEMLKARAVTEVAKAVRDHRCLGVRLEDAAVLNNARLGAALLVQRLFRLAEDRWDIIVEVEVR